MTKHAWPYPRPSLAVLECNATDIRDLRKAYRQRATPATDLEPCSLSWCDPIDLAEDADPSQIGG